MDSETPSAWSLRNIGATAASAGAITMLCLMIGTTAEEYADNSAPRAASQVASADKSGAARPNFNAIDFATTGAIKSGQTVVISPCTGRQVDN
jgi:predicted aconitase